MKKFFDSVKKAFSIRADDDPENMGDDEYVEIDTASSGSHSDGRIVIKPYVLEDFTDIRDILDTQKKTNTIALINIKPLKDKDVIEVKRAINKLKKNCEATDGSIAGFGENWVVVAPSFAEIIKVERDDDHVGSSD